VAIKKVPNAFNDLTDALRILREIRLMRHFGHENIVPIYDLGPPEALGNFEDVYIMSELMETDLHRIIYSRQDLSDEHLQVCCDRYMNNAHASMATMVSYAVFCISNACCAQVYSFC
jgi:serine/threonine protein kinase